MQILPDSQLKFQCKKCDKELYLRESEIGNLKWSTVLNSDKNIVHSFYYEANHLFPCKCGNDIEIKFKITEWDNSDVDVKISINKGLLRRPPLNFEVITTVN